MIFFLFNTHIVHLIQLIWLQVKVIFLVSSLLFVLEQALITQWMRAMTRYMPMWGVVYSNFALCYLRFELFEKSNTQSKLFLQTSYDKAWDKYAILSQAIARN